MQNRFFPTLHTIDAGDAAVSMVDPAAHRLHYKGCQLHYWLSGALTAPLVVLTHSEGANHHSFDEQLQTLARSYRVLTWDIRGHGQSKSDQHFTLEQAVDDLRSILANEGYTNAVFVGVSAGGLIAQLFAYRFPDFVRGLALLSCVPINAAETSANRFFGKLSTGLLSVLPYWFIMAQMPGYISVRPEVQKYTVEAMKESGKEQFLAAWQSKTQTLAIESTGDLPHPLLIACGAYDRPGWLTYATSLWEQSNPGVRIVTVPGAGHSLLQDNPSYTNKMLDDFLRQCLREKRQSSTLASQ